MCSMQFKSPLLDANEYVSICFSSDSKQIFVGGLPGTATEATVKTYFEQFGGIEEVQVSDCVSHLRGPKTLILLNRCCWIA